MATKFAVSYAFQPEAPRDTDRTTEVKFVRSSFPCPKPHNPNNMAHPWTQGCAAREQWAIYGPMRLTLLDSTDHSQN